MTKPLYFYNGTTFELVGPTTPQSPIAYQTSAPTGPATGDLWIDSDGDVDTYNRQLTRYYFVATAGQTTISGVDANGLTLAYVAGSEAVYVNGALQVRGLDYTATNGTSVVMSSALAVNDVVEIFAYTAFTVANAYTKSETDGIAAAAPGLRLLTPSSIAVGSGSGSVGTNGQVTFTGVSSLSLNDVFSTTYDNYLILIDQVGTADSDTNWRFRVSGSDNSNANYQFQFTDIQTVSSFGSNRTTNGTSGRVASLNNANRNRNEVTVYSPFLTQTTAWFSTGQKTDGTTPSTTFYSGVFNATTSFTGFTMLPQSGTFTGTVSVYGYKD